MPQYVGKTTMAIYQVEHGTLKITCHEPGRLDAPNAARIEVKNNVGDSLHLLTSGC